MVDRSGLSRGDRNRNARRATLMVRGRPCFGLRRIDKCMSPRSGHPPCVVVQLGHRRVEDAVGEALILGQNQRVALVAEFACERAQFGCGGLGGDGRRRCRRTGPERQ